MNSDPVLSRPRFSKLGERASPPTIAHLMKSALESPHLLSLAAGFTDTASLPTEAVREAVGKLMARDGEPEFLQYGLSQGRPQLRRLLAERLSRIEPELGLRATERIFVTNGSQQALYLAVQVLCNPGDIVLVDRPSYFVFLEMLTGLGVRALSLPVDDAGHLDFAGLAELLRRLHRTGESERVKCVYFVSYFSNPTGASMPEDEKIQLARVLDEERMVVPVIEDAAYRELSFQEPWPSRSVMSLDAWAGFPRLYLSTLTKPFATGLKVGYGLCSDETWQDKMLCVKGHHDFGTANFNQAIFEQVLTNGGFDRQLARIRPMYRRKMQALDEALRNEGLHTLGWSWARPVGGLYLWLRAPASLDTGMDGAFCRACIEGGVLYVPGELGFGDEPARNFVRLSFGVLGEPELREAGRRFVAVVRRFSVGGGS